MAEIKHTFTAAKMNKDLDERLVPNGEYRDAMNIQVRTTEGGASGTVQSIQGNTAVYTAFTGLDATDVKAVGSITDERNDKSYFLLAAPTFNVFDDDGTINTNLFSGTRYWRDAIVEVKSNGVGSNVVIDNFAITEPLASFNDGSGEIVAAGWSQLPEDVSADANNYRVGMQLQAFNAAGTAAFASPPVIVKLSSGTIYFDRTVAEAFNSTTCTYLVWTHPKALGLDQDYLVTGINVIDEFLFYTTGNSEPKKINLRRAKAGTAAAASNPTKHTKLFVDPQNGGPATSIAGYETNHNGDLLEEHITVIKKAPRSAPTLVMSETVGVGTNEFAINDFNFVEYAVSTNVINIGDPIVINVNASELNIIPGSTYILQLTDENTLTPPPTVSILVTSVGNGAGWNDVIAATLVSRSSNTTSSHTDWTATLFVEDNKLFELKFARFGTRYKYNDNEYSSFSPFSEIAFLPGEYEYNTIKGYNLGMVNLLKDLRLKNVIPTGNEVRIDEVKSIDILYKSTDSPTVYVIKTINRDLDPEWEKLSTGYKDAEIRITSDMVHKIVPNDQILRSWDNVPRIAKAQEIVGNRLVFGNYVQGYDIPFNVAVEQGITTGNTATALSPKKSIKSLRSYKFGIVLGDKYGRETPVMATGTRTFPNETTGDITNTDSSYLSKAKAISVNKFTVKQNWDQDGLTNTPPSWADYVKYYVKETSNEYYNLVMDRWYNAEDGNIWVSFPSVDRNKVDGETFLILKKDHGSNDFVPDEGRYKIIAIESEAPEFIKYDNRIVDKIAVQDDIAIGDEGVVDYNDENEPENLIERVEFDLPTNVFAFQEFKGTLKVRIVAEAKSSDGATTINILKSEYKTVTKNNNNKFHISSPWGEQGFVDTFINAGNYENVAGATTGLGAIEYWFEFMEQVVVNKPEFDGRFFVKVERDTTINSFVLKISDDFLYNTISSKYKGYIKSVYTSPTGGDNFSGYGSGVITGGNNYFAVNSADGISKTKAFWNGFTQAENNQGVFIDAANHAGAFKINSQSITYTETITQPDGSEEIVVTGSGTVYIEEVDTTTVGVSKFTTSGADRGFAQSGMFGVESSTYDRIFLSITKNASSGINQSKFSAQTSSNNFKVAMRTNGTRFRFANDPNESVYQIITGGTDDNPAQSDLVRLKNWYDISVEDLQVYNNNRSRQSFYTTFRRVIGNEVTNSGIDFSEWDPRSDTNHDGSNGSKIEILNTIATYDGELDSNSDGAVWETEPKEGTELDIYYEASNAIPMRLDGNNTIEFAPLNSTVNIYNPDTQEERVVSNQPVTVTRVFDSVVELKDSTNTLCVDIDIALNDIIVFTHPDGTKTRSTVTMFVHNDVVTNGVIKTNSSARTGRYQIDKDAYKNKVELNWSNCYTFGNGVESDRIRDDFNAATIDNGVHASTTVLDYKREDKYNSIIYSSIFNPNSDVNGLNEFNMSQKITKDLNPVYGKIQALKTRDTDLITFTEDKVLRLLANKDALYNADGNTNITASDRVLGQAVPYAGDYGISNDPESLSTDQYRMYFTDKQRGAVLRLSRDGITPISNVGMKSWFRDNLYKADSLIGSFDTVNGEYNLSIHYKPEYVLDDTTIAFNEAGKGWVSFRSFVADSGLSVSGKYLTSKGAIIYKHHVDVDTNGVSVVPARFYTSGAVGPMHLTLLINDMPGVIKNFRTINYEGTQAYVEELNNYDASSLGHSGTWTSSDYSSVTSTIATVPLINGWRIQEITTDLEEGRVEEFKNKEGKWFGSIVGKSPGFTNVGEQPLDESQIYTQGLGVPAHAITFSTGDTDYELTIEGGE
jgi:hypothetical protein